jgi:hypothetical protein
MIHSVEDAYNKIGSILLASAPSPEWQLLTMKTPILANGCGGVITVQRNQNAVEMDLTVGFGIFEIEKAVLCLRENLLRTTGQRIWGLTFILYPTGKFSIEYDYNKPKGYEETEETIDAGHAIASLQNLLAGSSDNKPK